MTDQKGPKTMGPEIDKNKLLLLGLNLLNRGLKLPCAVVHPQSKTPPPKGPSLLVEKLKTSPVSPDSVQKPPVVELDLEGSRKRKRDPTDDLINETDKREKRFVHVVGIFCRLMFLKFYL